MIFVKICGIQSLSDAMQSLDNGASAVGFLVGITHRAEDQISASAAAGIVRALPREASAVLVTHLQDSARVADLARDIGVGTIQLHDEMEITGIEALRVAIPGIAIVKAVHVEGADSFARARHYAPYVDALLLDSRTADRLGGTGKTHDWAISAEMVRMFAPMPVYLAGGLTPANVGDAIRRVNPAGVDVNSGVEDEFGGKSAEKVKRFVAEAREACAALV
jgi:phosphoribosylanthranilate isomerase